MYYDIYMLSRAFTFIHYYYYHYLYRYNYRSYVYRYVHPSQVPPLQGSQWTYSKRSEASPLRVALRSSL